MTTTVKFSTAVIKKFQYDTECNELRDPRYPLRLRFHKSRERASWYLLVNESGKTKWKKLGNWPCLKFDDIKANLSRFIVKHSLNPKATLGNQYPTINLLMIWYLKRSETDASLTKLRKNTIRWAISAHIIPLIGPLKLSEISRQALEEKLFWPLQTKLQASTIRSIWNVLKQATSKATYLNLIEPTELNSLKFTDYIKNKIKPAPTKLRVNQLPDVYSELKHTKIPTQMLFILILAHGTRIGETSKLKWHYFCFDSNELIIPGKITKNGDELIIPLTDYIIKLISHYRRYQKQKRYKGVYLFPNKGRSNVINLAFALEMINDISFGVWTSHSLRKIFRSTLLELGVDSEISEMMLNHRRGALSETYIHTTAPKLKRQALEKYHQFLITIEPQILQLTAQ